MVACKSKSSILLLWLWLAQCQGQLLERPEFLWRIKLDDSKTRTLQKGNAVVASQDGEHIFATTADGSLHIINNKNVEPPIITVFEPPAIDGAALECSSGVVIVNDGVDNSYLVYAVTHGNNSTIFAVDFNGSLKWQVVVEGQIVGTPVVSERAVYFSRNTDVDKGFLSVLLLTNDQPELAASLSPTEGSAPLGPPSLSIVDGEDAVTVAESWDQGYGDQGNVYIILPSNDYDRREGRGNESYEMLHVSSWPYSSVTKPIMMGSSLWLAAAGSNIGGWDEREISRVIEGRRDDVDPSWERQLDVSEVDEEQPILTTPAISRDLSMLVVPGSNGELYGIRADDGRVEWTNQPYSVILAEPIVVDDIVYVIESEKGILRQHSINEGIQFWRSDCEKDDSCGDKVLADFSIAPSGNVIYYGDVSGHITATQVANFETPVPTDSPSLSPTATPRPTMTASPTQFIPPSSQPTDSSDDSLVADGENLKQHEGEDSDETAVVVASVISGLILAGALVAVWFFVGRRRKNKNDTGPKKDSGNASDRDLEHGFSRMPRNISLFRKKHSPPPTMNVDIDEEVRSIRMHEADDSTRDLNDTFSLAAESECDDAGDNADNPIILKEMLPCDRSCESGSDDSNDNFDTEGPVPSQVPEDLDTPSADTHAIETKGEDKEEPTESTSFNHMYAADSSVAKSDASHPDPPASPTLTYSEASYADPPESPISTCSESSLYMGSVTVKSIDGSNYNTPNFIPTVSTYGTSVNTGYNEDAPATEAASASSQHSQCSDRTNNEDEVDRGYSSAPDDEENARGAPGAHYMVNSSMENPKSLDNVGRSSSLRSVRQMDKAPGLAEEGVQQGGIENWDSFMDELAEAEKMFSQPNLKSSNLLSDDESTDAGSSIMSYFDQARSALLGSDSSL